MTSRVALAGLVALVFGAACQPGAPQRCNTQIDWVNFVEVGSTQYVAGPQDESVLQEGDLGAVYAHVKHRVSGNVCDPTYILKDGDAAFLEPGTAIYQVKGYPPSQRLAARFNGRIVLYRAATPAA